LHKTVTLI